MHGIRSVGVVQLMPQHLGPAKVSYEQETSNIVVDRFINRWRTDSLRVVGNKRTLALAINEAKSVSASFDVVEKMRKHPNGTLRHALGSAPAHINYHNNHSPRSVILWRLEDIDSLLSGCGVAILRQYAERTLASGCHGAFVSQSDSKRDSGADLALANLERITNDPNVVARVFVGSYKQPIPIKEFASIIKLADCAWQRLVDGSSASTDACSVPRDTSHREDCVSLTDLPFELLHLIVSCCDFESRLCLAGTCTRLQHAALELLIQPSEHVPPSLEELLGPFAGLDIDLQQRPRHTLNPLMAFSTTPLFADPSPTTTTTRVSHFCGKLLPTTAMATHNWSLYSYGFTTVEGESLEIHFIEPSNGWAFVRNVVGVACWLPLSLLRLPTAG